MKYERRAYDIITVYNIINILLHAYVVCTVQATCTISPSFEWSRSEDDNVRVQNILYR